MNTLLTRVVLIALVGAGALAQTVTINSLLNVVVCQPNLISWVGGTAPYYLSILPANQPTATPLVDLGTQTGTSTTWITNLAVGTSAFLQIRDSTGTIGQSGEFTVLTGSDTSCVGQSPSTTSGATTSGGASTGTNPSTTSKPASSTTSSTTASKAATVGQYSKVGTVAMLGAAVLALVV